ncbi:unnamed protein product, partial [Cladocopium goreaui]
VNQIKTTTHDHPLPSMDLHGRVGHAEVPLPSMDLYGGGQSAEPSGLAGHSLPSMDLCGGDGAALNAEVPHEDDDVLIDEGGDMPPDPESAEDLPEPADPLHEEPPPQPGPDGPPEESLR